MMIMIMDALGTERPTIMHQCWFVCRFAHYTRDWWVDVLFFSARLMVVRRVVCPKRTPRVRTA